MKPTSLRNRKGQLAFGIAILALLLVGAISYRGMLLSGESDRWVRHTYQVIEIVQDLQAALEMVENSSREFALTGREEYLEAYRAGISRINKDQDTVRALTADNPEQQRSLTILERLVTEKIQATERINTVRRAKGLDAALEAIRIGQAQRTGRGKEIVDDFEGVIRELRAEERRLLVLREADAKRRLGQTRAILLIGTVAGLLITAAAGWIVQRDNIGRGVAEEALRASEETYRMVLDGIQDYAIYMLDPRGTVVSWNTGAERITGYKAEEMIGHTVFRFYSAEEVKRGKPEEILLRAASGRYEEQGMRTRKDGRRFLTSVTLTALRDPNGQLRGFSGISRDLTESMESEARYRGLLEAAPDATVVVNPRGEIVLLNVQAEKQFGYRRDELVGQQVKSIIPEGFAERLVADGLRSVEDALAQQIGTGIELTGRRKNGSEFPIEIMLSPLESAEGILVTAAIRDITVRKDAERHLAQMEGRYRGLLEAAPDAMVVVNRGGEIVLLNVQAEKRFGYSRAELLGQKVKNIIPQGFAERLIADALRSTEDALGQQIGTGLELTGRRKNGSEFPIELMLSPLDSAEGLLVTAAIRDITGRKTAEALLLQKLDELSRSNEELAQFAYVASHDLQEPLRMVASYTQLLSRRYKGKLDSDADEFIAFAVDGAGRMQRLIQDLLLYSRVGTKGRDLLATSSEDALQQALMNLRNAIEESGAQVTHDPLPAVLADEMQLVQLFQNLVGNAIKYQSPGIPRVHIAAARDGDKTWSFSVKDNGLGIDSQYFKKIFGMFQRLHKREEFAGTGIGLAICKKIVERHGGSISVESEPGQGSTFRFALAGSEKTS